MENANDNLNIDYRIVFEFYLRDYKLWHTECTGEVLPEKDILKLATEAWMSSPLETQMQNFKALAEVVKQEFRKNEEAKAHIQMREFSSEQLPRCVVRFLKSPQAVHSKRNYYLSKYPQCLKPYINSKFVFNYYTPALSTRSADTPTRMVPTKSGTNLFPLTNQQLDDNKKAESKESKDEILLDVQVSEKETKSNLSQKKQPISEWHRKLGQQLPRCVERFLNPERRQVAYSMRKYYLPFGLWFLRRQA